MCYKLYNLKTNKLYIIIDMSTRYGDITDKKFGYWSNKPVMKLNEIVGRSSYLQNDTKLNTNTLQSTTSLPTGYTWNKVDICDDKHMTDISLFLSEHYKRGSNSEYTITYTKID